VILAGFQPRLGARRWIPLALVSAGAVSNYSLQGLAWLAVFVAAWWGGRALATGWRSGWRASLREQRAELLPFVWGAIVLVVVLVPQIPRIHRFIAHGAANSIPKANLGNLAGPLPGWEAFGTWNGADFRFPALPAFTAGTWTALVLALVLVGGVAMVRRGRAMLPAAAGLSMLLWAYSNHSQSPYVAAKALVIASPLLLLLAALALLERPHRPPSWWVLLAPVLAVVLVVKVADSSLQALRFSKVAPTTHLDELRSLRATIGTQPTLFLGHDDFVLWELAGARVTPAFYAGVAEVPLRPQKMFVDGQPLDFDSVSTSTLDAYDWVITTRDAAGSQAPAQMRLVRATRDYELWRRTGPLTPRQTLDEGPGAAALLQCKTAAGRRVLARGGVAAVRGAEHEVPVPPLPPGGGVTVSLPLSPGIWDLETAYTSPLSLTVTAPGLHRTLPANLDRPGPRWPIGRVTVTATPAVQVTFHLAKHWLTPASDAAVPGSLTATPVGAERLVPIRSACGAQVDWYRAP
jgi:hypothetical protein